MRRPACLALTLRSAAFGDAVGERDHAGHRQPMPVLHGNVAHIAELCFAPGRLAIKTAVGIGRACVRVVLTLLSVESAPPSPSPEPSCASLGRKLFWEASINVPSTEKCSSDSSGLTCGWLLMNLANTSPFCGRSRFFVNTVGSQTGSS